MHLPSTNLWQTPGVGDGQGGLACCDSWGHKESDTTERMNWTELNWTESLTRVPRAHSWKKIVSSTNDDGKTENLHATELNWILISHHIQN